MHYLCFSAHYSLQRRRQHDWELLKSEPEYLSDCKEVLEKGLSGLEVNPEQVTLYIGDVLYNEELHAWLKLPKSQYKQLAVDWLVASGSFGNATALYYLSNFYREELSKILFQGRFEEDRFQELLGGFVKKDIYDIFSSNQETLSERVAQRLSKQNDDKHNNTEAFLKMQFDEVKEPKISRILVGFNCRLSSQSEEFCRILK